MSGVKPLLVQSGEDKNSLPAKDISKLLAGVPKGGVAMLDTSLLSSVARQMTSAEEVEVDGQRLPVRRTSKQGLRTVTFIMQGHQYAAIEQNPEKPSRWGQLARGGHQVVQFKDVQSNRFVAVAVDGEAKEYGGGKSRR